MKLTAQQVFDATLTLAAIIRENRPCPQKGAYRLARLHAKLMPEFTLISTRRDEMITAYGYVAPEGHASAGMQAVPPDKAEEFNAAWAEFSKDEIDVDVQPIPLAYLDNGDDRPGSVSASELIVLGELVAE